MVQLLVDGEKIFGEVVGGQKKIVICGGGHVSLPIIQLGRQIGCYVTVLEDRPKFADNARRAGADKVICDTFEAGLEQIPGEFRYVFCNRYQADMCMIGSVWKVL